MNKTNKTDKDLINKKLIKVQKKSLFDPACMWDF